MPAYIASLPVRPSEPTTPAPFNMPVPTPNTLANPNRNYCGHGWESAMEECYHACPSGNDDECPSGKTCHTWLTCTPSAVDPALYNVCGRNWLHAGETCATRCYLGNDDDCPSGEACFGGVTDCDEGKLPPLTAVDVGLAERAYTTDEIKILLDEEIARERDEEAMNNPKNWWCGASHEDMLETCGRRCKVDEDCRVDAWTPGFCFRTTGGVDNCSKTGVPVKSPGPGSRWCGHTWNDMLENCSQECKYDMDCKNGGKCWDAPDTCKYVGVPVVEKISVELSNGGGEASGTAVSGSYCGSKWETAADGCTQSCEEDMNCPENQWCYWVTCNNLVSVESVASGGGNSEGDNNNNLPEPPEEEISCSAEVRRCTNGQYVGRAPQLNCEFYPCPDGGGGYEGIGAIAAGQSSSSSSSSSSSGGPSPASGSSLATNNDNAANLVGWGSTPLTHACTSDGLSNCGLCQGDCNSDDDCKGGLMCFSRGSGEVTSIPGCISGGEGDKPGMDYCYTPFEPEIIATTTTEATTTAAEEEAAYSGSIGELNYARECTGDEPCGACEGDCDDGPFVGKLWNAKYNLQREVRSKQRLLEEDKRRLNRKKG